ncbi:MAG: universal stress protein [Flavobacteriales bacterium]
MKNILVPVELDQANERVVDQAAAIAHAFDPQIWLVHVAAPDPAFVGYEPGPQYIRDLRADELREEHALLQRWRDKLIARGLRAQALLVQGVTAETILEQADRLNADLIVMGSHGRHGIRKALLGSACSDVLHANRRPVLVVPIHEVN